MVSHDCQTSISSISEAFHATSGFFSPLRCFLSVFFRVNVFKAHLTEACALWALGRSNLEADPSTSSWIKVNDESDRRSNTDISYVSYRLYTVIICNLMYIYIYTYI